MRTLLLTLLVLLVVLVAGCNGGSSSHTVVTNEEGSMLGLVITPSPQTLNIDRTTDFQLDWPAGYTPPAEFTLTLRSVSDTGDTTAVLTNLDTVSTGHYVLRPGNTLAASTFLLLTLASDREQVRAMFLTDSRVIPMTRQAQPGQEGQAEHVVKTR